LAKPTTASDLAGGKQASKTSKQMNVPLLDLRAQYKPIENQVQRVFAEILESQQMINGPAVGELECAVAGYCDVPSAVGVSSGTDALIAALMALEIGAGDEVITTPYTFFATAGSIWRVGAKPVFVDIEQDTFNIDASKIEAAITDKTKAIMPVHLFGQTADMDPIVALADKHGLKVIEDAAQAIGSRYKGKPAGSIGDVGCFSFFPSKNLGGAGDGGMVVTRDNALGQRLLRLRNHGAHERYFHDEVGGNFRLDTLQAAYLNIKLPLLEGWSQARRNNAEMYDELLADVSQVTTPTISEHNTSIFNQYIIRAEKRDDLMKHLQANNIGVAIYYPLGLHEQACFASLGYTKGDFPNTEAAAATTLALPVYPEMEAEQVRYVASKIAAFYAA